MAAVCRTAQRWSARSWVHGDATPSTVIVTPSVGGMRARLIDLKHAGLGDPAWDLATAVEAIRRTDADAHKSAALMRVAYSRGGGPTALHADVCRRVLEDQPSSTPGELSSRLYTHWYARGSLSTTRRAPTPVDLWRACGSVWTPEAGRSWGQVVGLSLAVEPERLRDAVHAIADVTRSWATPWPAQMASRSDLAAGPAASVFYLPARSLSRLYDEVSGLVTTLRPWLGDAVLRAEPGTPGSQGSRRPWPRPASTLSAPTARWRRGGGTSPGCSSCSSCPGCSSRPGCSSCSSRSTVRAAGG